MADTKYTVEGNLERIADAFVETNKNLGALIATLAGIATAGEARAEPEKQKLVATADKPKPAADKPKAEAEPEKPKVTKTKDDVRKALQAYREIEGTAAMLEILRKHGADNLNDLTEDKYDAVVEAVKP